MGQSSSKLIIESQINKSHVTGKIDLKKSELTDEAVKTLAVAIKSKSCLNLAHLDLENNNITDKGIKALAAAIKSRACPNLMHLDLEWNHLTDEGARALIVVFRSGACPNLTELYLGYNNITPLVTQEIETFLKKQSKITAAHETEEEAQKAFLTKAVAEARVAIEAQAGARVKFEDEESQEDEYVCHKQLQTYEQPTLTDPTKLSGEADALW